MKIPDVKNIIFGCLGRDYLVRNVNKDMKCGTLNEVGKFRKF